MDAAEVYLIVLRSGEVSLGECGMASPDKQMSSFLDQSESKTLKIYNIHQKKTQRKSAALQV